MPTPPKFGDVGFTFSPGGDSLLVVYWTDTTVENLVLVDRLTGERTPLGVIGAYPSWVAGRQDILFTAFGSSARLHPGDWTVQSLGIPGLSPHATWHPTAPIIAVVSNNGVNTNPPDLWLTDSIGGSLRRIPLAGPPRDQTAAPSWAPDGKRLVASVVGRLIVLDTSAVDTASITPPSQYADFPAWAPGGAWIAYHAHASNASEYFTDVFLVRPDGTSRHRLISGALYPKWSPDGSRIAFIRTGDDGESAVWSVDTLGHDLEQVTFPPH